MVGLQQHLARALGAARAPATCTSSCADFSPLRKSAENRPSSMPTDHQGQPRQIVALGQHLRADQDPGRVARAVECACRASRWPVLPRSMRSTRTSPKRACNSASMRSVPLPCGCRPRLAQSGQACGCRPPMAAVVALGACRARARSSASACRACCSAGNARSSRSRGTAAPAHSHGRLPGTPVPGRRYRSPRGSRATPRRRGRPAAAACASTMRTRGGFALPARWRRREVRIAPLAALCRLSSAGVALPARSARRARGRAHDGSRARGSGSCRTACPAAAVRVPRRRPAGRPRAAARTPPTRARHHPPGRAPLPARSRRAVVGEPGLQRITPAPSRAEPRQRLRGQADLRDQHQRLLAAREAVGDRLEVDLGLPLPVTPSSRGCNAKPRASRIASMAARCSSFGRK